MFHRILIMTNVLAQCVNLILRAEIAYFSKFDQTKNELLLSHYPNNNNRSIVISTMTLRLILSLIVIGVCVRVNFGIDMRCSNCEKNPSMFNCFDIKDGIAQVTFCDVFLSAGYNKTKYILFLFQ